MNRRSHFDVLSSPFVFTFGSMFYILGSLFGVRLKSDTTYEVRRGESVRYVVSGFSRTVTNVNTNREARSQKCERHCQHSEVRETC